MNWVYTLKVEKTINFEKTSEIRLFSTLAKATTAFDEAVKEAKNDFGFAFENGKPLKNWELVDNNCIFDLWLYGEASKHSCFIQISTKEVE